MADAARDIPRLTASEYLQLEKQATCKHEFVNGIVYARAGASRRPNFIATDITSILIAKLTPPCQPYALDVKVHVETATDERYYYPDVLVTCSDLDNDPYLITQPSLIVEVVSSSTEAADRGSKFDAYRKLPSLQEYLLVLQEKAQVEVFRRRTEWQPELYGLHDEINLESVKLSLPVAMFYRRITF